MIFLILCFFFNNFPPFSSIFSYLSSFSSVLFFFFYLILFCFHLPFILCILLFNTAIVLFFHSFLSFHFFHPSHFYFFKSHYSSLSFSGSFCIFLFHSLLSSRCSAIHIFNSPLLTILFLSIYLFSVFYIL